MNEQVTNSKQASQARLLGRCLAALLAVNLLVVGLSLWTGTSNASVETKGIAGTSQPPTTPKVAEAAKADAPKVANPAKVTPESIPVQSPAKSVFPVSKTATAPPTTTISSPATSDPPADPSAPPPMPSGGTISTAPDTEFPAMPTPVIDNDPPTEIPASSEPTVPIVVRVVNPGDTGGVVHYSVNGTVFSLSPGEYHEISPEGASLVEFHRGGDFGYAKTPVPAGDYLFGVGDTGWSLAPGILDPAVTIRRAH